MNSTFAQVLKLGSVIAGLTVGGALAIAASGSLNFAGGVSGGALFLDGSKNASSTSRVQVNGNTGALTVSSCTGCGGGGVTTSTISDFVQVAHRQLSSAEVLSMTSSTFYQMIPAQGAGKIVIPLIMHMKVTYNSVTYTNGAALTMAYGTSTNGGATLYLAIGQSIAATSIKTTATSFSTTGGAPLNTYAANTTFIGQTMNVPVGLTLAAAGAPYGAGNSVIDFWITYTVLNSN